MASIIDSFRETFSDSMSLLKIAVLAVPLYFSYDLFLKSTKDFTGCIFLLSITIFLLFGFLIDTTNGILNDKDSILPSINPLKLAGSAIKGIIAIGPASVISVLLANYIISFIKIIPWLDITLTVLLWIVVAAIIFTEYLMFVKHKKIKDAYNVKMLSEKSGELIISIIVFLIQFLVMNLLSIGFLTYTLIVLFGIGPITYFFFALAIVFNVGVIGHYLAQLQYELMGA